MLPPSFICGNTYFNPIHTPFTLTLINLSNASSGYSVNGTTTPSIPALLKNTSIFPNVFTVCCTYFCTSLVFVTSAATKLTFGLFSSDATLLKALSLISTNTTFAPSAKNNLAVVEPIAPEPPVITVILFVNFVIIFLMIKKMGNCSWQNQK